MMIAENTQYFGTVITEGDDGTCHIEWREQDGTTRPSEWVRTEDLTFC